VGKSAEAAALIGHRKRGMVLAQRPPIKPDRRLN